jgi:cellobiose-specific phosphotransferase system component IIA
LAESSGNKLCPICDSPLQPGSKKCGFCGTDLSIFDIETELPKQPEPVVAPPPPRVSVESRIEEIFSKPLIQERPPAPEPKPVPSPKAVPSAPVREPEPVRVLPPEPKPEPKPQPAPRAPAKRVEYFECPECGSSVETTANSCPKCGVLFAEEGAEMFQCPACNTLVSVDATTCPGCGAIFVEPEAQAATVAEEPRKELEPAVEEVKAALEPIKEEMKEEPEPKLEEGEKKGFMRWFKRGKKDEKEPEKTEEPEEEKMEPEKAKPAPTPAPPPTVRIEPARAPKPRVEGEVQIREVRPGPAAETVPSIQPKPQPSPAPAPPREVTAQGKDKGRDLARMVAEMKPLLALAREKDVDIGESKGLIDEAATAGRERQLDRAIELVQESKNMLLAKVDAQLSDQIMKLNEEIKVAREFGGDISKATMYIQEVAKARGAGDIEAAYVYADKVKMELLPITGRYNDSKRKIASAKQLVADCEAFIVDTRDARRYIVEANKAFDSKDFDKVDALVKSSNESLAKVIPKRMNEEITAAKELLIDAKTRNVNISPMITVLKSATNLMKSGDYGQAVKEMREFRDMIKKTK